MVNRNLERANENDGFKMTALESIILSKWKENNENIYKSTKHPILDMMITLHLVKSHLNFLSK